MPIIRTSWRYTLFKRSRRPLFQVQSNSSYACSEVIIGKDRLQEIGLLRGSKKDFDLVCRNLCTSSKRLEWEV